MQKLPEQYNGKTRIQGTITNNHTEYCTHTWQNANIQRQDVYFEKKDTVSALW
jgi:hypothetical protein